MCYTSGTTGHPKGVLYSHRGDLSALLRRRPPRTCSASVERDVILHIVPMFHANAWCVPFAGVMNGSTQIFGGPNPQPRDIIEIVHNEKVTRGGGGAHRVDRHPGHPREGAPVGHLLHPLHPHRRLGGAQEPDRALRQEVRGLHAPRLGHDRDVPARQRVPAALLHGRPPGGGALRRPRQAGAPVAGVDMRIVDDTGRVLPWDGKSVGRDPGARAVGDERVLQQPGGRGPVHRGRLVPHGRRRLPRPRRLHPDHRSHQGPDQVRRRVDLERRHGDDASWATRRCSRPR